MTYFSKVKISSLLISFLPILITIIVTYCFYPGFMSVDSLNQYVQAKKGIMNDWHPVIMSWTWHYLNFLHDGPLLMLVLQNLVFWTGMALIIYSAIKSGVWKVRITLCFLIFPPILALLSTIWKDVEMGSFLVLSLGLILFGAHVNIKKKILISPLLLFTLIYSAAVRYNSLPAVIPIVFCIGLLWINGKLWKKILVSIFLTFLIILASFLINTIGTNGEKQFPIQQILTHDLVALSLNNNKVYLPEFMSGKDNAEWKISELRQIYTPLTVVPLYCCGNNIKHLVLTSNKRNIDELIGSWKKNTLIFFYPYLIHRADVYIQTLSLNNGPACYPFMYGDIPNTYGIVFHPNIVNISILNYLDFFKDSLFFRPYFYLVISIVILFFAIWKKQLITSLVLISGILYNLCYFFVATTCDFRMTWWTTLSTLIGILLFIQGINNSKR